MKRLIPLCLLALALVTVALAVTTPAPAKVNLPKGTTMYFGHSRFLLTHNVDTLVWSSARKFVDSTNYYCGVFVSGRTTSGVLSATLLNDSSIIVTSTAAADSAFSYYYQVLLQAK